jgi:ATP-binding cassette, subfamily B, bacterial MsbA
MQRFQRLLGYLKPYRLHLLGAVICAVLVALLTATYAYLVKPVLDEIFFRKDTGMLAILPLIVLVTSALKGGATYGRAYLMRFVANRIIRDIRDQLYQHLLVMPLGFFNRHTTGKLMSRVLNDVTLVQTLISNVVKDLFQQVITLIFLVGVLFYQNWVLALMAIVVLPLAYYPIKRYGRRLRRISQVRQEKMADLSGLLHETFSGIRIVKGFTGEEYEVGRFKARNRDYTRKTMKTVRISELAPFLMEVIGALGAALIIWTGGYQVVQGSMSPGAFFSFLAACWLMYAPVRHITRAHNTIQISLAGIDRVYAMLDSQTERHLEKEKKELVPFQREIQFQDITFYYEGSREPALENVSFTVKAGELVALVGISGAGKTTLANLIPRFFEASAGHILVDGVKIREVTLSSLRRQIGIVSQDTVLFDDTVANNIAYGARDASYEDIVNAAKTAYAQSFIEKLPESYQTVIGEQGFRLSGGERQRLAIARAILKNPPILILDEATSNLDAESEEMIQKALAHLFKDRTTFVIAHRLSTVMNAHKILVIEQGHVVETGQHDELLKKGGLYRRLYELQFRDTSPYVRTRDS